MLYFTLVGGSGSFFGMRIQIRTAIKKSGQDSEFLQSVTESLDAEPCLKARKKAGQDDTDHSTVHF